MIVHAFTDPPGASLAHALARLEELFTYPLGPGRSFRISHGDDYPRFFRAIGEGVCFVAERAGEVLGVLGLASTTLATPQGPRRIIYLGDLKIAPTARGGRVLLRLAEAAAQWCRGRAACGFGVVMDGTPVTPDRYTGRLGIPQFREAARISVLRIPSCSALRFPPAGWEQSSEVGESCFARLSMGVYATLGGNPAERSESPPCWLVAPDGSACCRMEDTRRAKRLIANDGREMISAHLSCIGFRDVAALGEILSVSRSVAAERGFPAILAAVPAADTPAILKALGEPDVVVAPATVYSSGLEPGRNWTINTAEI